MLEHLTIKNYALIEDLEIDFKEALNVFTGETGAGKSIVINALGLVLGDRASTSSIRKGACSCTVKAVFDVAGKRELLPVLREQGIPQEEVLILSREIALSGKNKCLANGQIITLGMLQCLGQHLVDLHGQHEHQALLLPAEQMNILDEYGDLWSLRKCVGEEVARYQSLCAEWQAMLLQEKERAHLEDLYGFQLKELQEAEIRTGEEEIIDKEINLLTNAEKIFSHAHEARQRLYESEESVLSNLQKIKSDLLALQSFDRAFEPLSGLLQESVINLEEVNSQIRAYQEKIVFDPQRLDQCLERKELIARLKRKYGQNIQEILQYQEKITGELKAVCSWEENRGKLQRNLAETKEEVLQIARSLSTARKATALKLEKEVERELKDLGLQKMKFKVEFIPHLDENGNADIRTSGLEQVVFLISANIGEDLKPLSHIASGGEISRIMLCLKTCLAEADKIPVLVFDEIDTGIGGAMAELVGKKLALLAKKHQIICVTHWPQIAGFAGFHLQVAKSARGGRTYTEVAVLSENERVDELARMLGGHSLTEISISHARQLIKEGRVSN